MGRNQSKSGMFHGKRWFLGKNGGSRLGSNEISRLKPQGAVFRDWRLSTVRNASSAWLPYLAGSVSPLMGRSIDLPLDRRAETLAGALFAPALAARPLPMLSLVWFTCSQIQVWSITGTLWARKRSLRARAIKVCVSSPDCACTSRRLLLKPGGRYAPT